MRAKIFISYCHADKSFQRRLHQYLTQTRIHGDILDDTKLRAGTFWNKGIQAFLSRADLYVCFLSVDYYASSYITNYEIPEILNGAAAGKRVLLIYVGPLPSHDHLLSDLQGLNNPGRPLISMNSSEREEFFKSAAIEIQDAINSISHTPSLLRVLQVAKRVNTKTSSDSNKPGTPDHRLRRGDFSYNIVIVGRTGVGKSALFNYLFGEEIQRVGTGKPVTQRGFHRHQFELRGFFGNLFDSWGLEHGKEKDWQHELEVELKQRDISAPPEQWFHTVLFCIDATSERVQEFEASTIKALQGQKCNVIVVLTKSDLASLDTLRALRSTILDIVGAVPCVFVASMGTQLSIGMTEAFGIKELVDQILLSFANSVASRVPARCYWRIERHIDEWQNCAHAYIRTHSAWYNENRIAQNIDDSYKILVNDIIGEDGIYNKMLHEDIEKMVGIRLSIEGLFSHTAGNSQIRFGLPTEQRTKRPHVAVSLIKDSLKSDLSRVVGGLMAIAGPLLISNLAIAIPAGIFISITVVTGTTVARKASKQFVHDRLLQSTDSLLLNLRESIRSQQDKSAGELREQILMAFRQ